MDQKVIQLIAQQLGIQYTQVNNTIQLLDEGATVPFISRYRKERTGSLDEVQVEAVKDAKEKMEELLKRKETIVNTIQEQGLLTPELQKRINECFDPTELEDIYLPYKPKRRTRAMIAREKGLEPLAKIIMKQFEKNLDGRAQSFINDQVESVDDALAGARDIIAEWVNENERARGIVRREFDRGAFITSKVVKGKEEEGAKYSDYFEWKEQLRKCPSHRLMAMRRGEKEGILRVSVTPESTEPIDRLKRFFINSNNACTDQMELAIEDSYKRLLEPSIETEYSNLSKDKADDEAIRVFADNLRQLLLAAPLGQKRVLAIDPGYRTGCKVVCLDAQGNLLINDTIYPHPPQNELAQAAKKITTLVSSYQIEAIAIGNGTASRETESFDLFGLQNCARRISAVRCNRARRSLHWPPPA
jgi:uncharacterized protein